MFKLLVCLTGVLFVISSCSDKDPDPAPKTKTELITSSSWKFQSATASGTDVSNTPQISCFKDNIITFSANGSGSINEGVDICAPTTAGPFTWNFISNETQLYISAPLVSSGSNTFTLVSINETNLVVSQTVNFPPSSLVVITFKH